MCVFPSVRNGGSWEIGAGFSLSLSFISQGSPRFFSFTSFPCSSRRPRPAPPAHCLQKAAPSEIGPCASQRQLSRPLPWAPVLDHTTDVSPLLASDVSTHWPAGRHASSWPPDSALPTLSSKVTSNCMSFSKGVKFNRLWAL